MASDPQPARSASVREVDFRTSRGVGPASGSDAGGSFGGQSGKDSFSWHDSASGDSSRRRYGFVPGLLIGLVLVGLGVAVWYAYQWGLERGYSEEVPIIQASAGPYKVRPNAPGGLVVPDQDKLVLNEGGSDDGAAQVERLLSAPETPQPPQKLDEAEGVTAQAAAAAGEVNAKAVTEIQETVATVPEVQVPLPEAEPEVDAIQTAQADAPQASESQAAEPVPDEVAPAAPEAASSEPEAAANQAEAAEAAQQAAASSEPSVTIQAAQPAPSDASGATEALGSAGGGASAAPKLQLAAVKDGDYVIQLASVTSSNAATDEWSRLQKRFPGLLADMKLAVQEATVKGTLYHRVQTGPFPSRATAQDMCAQIKTQKQPCIVQRR